MQEIRILKKKQCSIIAIQQIQKIKYHLRSENSYTLSTRSIEKTKHSTDAYEDLKNTARYCDRKTVMEPCHKIILPSVVKIISKKQLFFILKLGLKHDNSLKSCKKTFFQPPSCDFFRHPLERKQTYLFSWPCTSRMN